MSVLLPKWTNALPTFGAVGALGGLIATIGGFWYWATPSFFEVGYMPVQPGGGFNHQIHAGMLGMDCRYCHSNVERSPEANIPAVSTCYGCHEESRLSVAVEGRIGEKVAFIREAYKSDQSIAWSRVHKLPDYVRNFPHHLHVKAGVSCLSCHGNIIGMPEVVQRESLSMGWCLDCHRAIEGEFNGEVSRPDLAQRLVDPARVTQLKWLEENWFNNPGAHADEAKRVLHSLKEAPPQNCGACHY